MDVFIRTKLQPTEFCIVCTEPFSAEHQPVALQCNHIFGHQCIKKWLREGRGNTNSCPFCRHEIHTPSDIDTPFDDTSIWNALCEQSPEHIHDFMTALWQRVQKLCAERLTGDFATHELLDRAVIPALSRASMTHDAHGPFHDCFGLVVSTWNSLGRPDTAQGLAVPLVRLVRLMTQTSSILPKWMTTVSRTSVLFWRANAALGTSSPDISWSHLAEAAQLAPQYYPFLHLYTVLLSQNIVHSEPGQVHKHQEQAERCCKKIGAGWTGRPSEAFKESVLGVYEELRRHQVEEKKLSLRGHEEERAVVMGLWAIAMWRREDGARARAGSDASTPPRKPTGGWSE